MIDKNIWVHNFYCRRWEYQNSKAHLIAFCYDATRSHFGADAVVFPRHEQDVSDILKYYNRTQIIIV